MKKIILIFFVMVSGYHQSSESAINQLKENIINNKGTTVETRINVPDLYKRIAVENNSFAAYLRHLPLKPHKSKVQIYDGSYKEGENIYAAVIDMAIGNKDLHQCADAVMRLRAEYFFQQKQYDKIHFNFTNGFRADYTDWMKGRRIIVKGQKSYWIEKDKPSNTYKDFWNYMEIIFSYAGTLSLSKELKAVNIKDISIGDVFIQGGFPGHAVIVIDMAFNQVTKDKVFLLAQSYMPAQELQILCNPLNTNNNPWFSIKKSELLYTPEWTFEFNNIKRFAD